MNSKNNVLNLTPRGGFLKKGVPTSLAQTFGQHMMTTAQAVKTMVDYTPKRVINPEQAILMGANHDIVPHNFNRLPNQLEVFNLEDTLLKVQDLLVANEVYNAVEEYLKQESQDSQLVHDLGKMDTLVQALEYDRNKIGNDMSEFYENTPNSIINNQYFLPILEELLKNKNSANLSPFFQYMKLLQLDGNIDKFKFEMEKLKK